MKVKTLAGVDEVGRGALFGPVVAAAVIVPVSLIPTLRKLGVEDSKQLSACRRQALVSPIRELVLAWHISFADVPTIETLNIRQASLLAMKRALLGLNHYPDWCLVDGRDGVPDLPFPQTALIGGDRRSPVIGAASILAKVWRDNLMERLGDRFLGYDLKSNKGYGTLKHRQALASLGLTCLHRRHFCRKISGP